MHNIPSFDMNQKYKYFYIYQLSQNELSLNSLKYLNYPDYNICHF